MPCRIAFERGKERHFCFLAISVGTSGWLVLAEELPLKKSYGIVRVAAPLSGCNVCIVVYYPCILILKHAALLAENCTNLYWFPFRKNPRIYNLNVTIIFNLISHV